MDDNCKYYEFLSDFLRVCNKIKLLSDNEYRGYFSVIQESWIEPDEEGVNWAACYVSDIERECRRVLNKL